jgi:peptide/nickel transport system permease protein
MPRTILKRVLGFVVTLLSITLLAFLLLSVAPSDAAEVMLRGTGVLPSNDMIEGLRHDFGLDRSLLSQYLSWLGALLQGDLGTSFAQSRPVTDILISATIKTAQLTLLAFALTVIVSIPLGVLCAKYRNSWGDWLIRIFSYGYASIPSFVIGVTLLYIFAERLKILPAVANIHEAGLVMPVFVLASTCTAWMVRQVRTIFLEKMSDPYVLGLRARGISEWRIDLYSVLRSAMVPIVTSLGLCLGSMLGGAVIAEMIFTWNGLGRVVLTAIDARDYPVLLGFTIWIAVIYYLINIIIDILYGVFDPRIRKGYLDDHARDK